VLDVVASVRHVLRLHPVRLSLKTLRVQLEIATARADLAQKAAQDAWAFVRRYRAAASS
jgi:hypothetical protein